jgi:hypothetical protein
VNSFLHAAPASTLRAAFQTLGDFVSRCLALRLSIQSRGDLAIRSKRSDINHQQSLRGGGAYNKSITQQTKHHDLYLYTYIHMYIYLCICNSVFTYIHTYIYIYILIYVSSLYLYIYVYICMYTYIYMCIYIYSIQFKAHCDARSIRLRCSLYKSADKLRTY